MSDTIDSRKRINSLWFSTTKKVVFSHWIVINDYRFDASDLYDTLKEVSQGDSYLTDSNMIAALKSIHVLEWEGHRDMRAQMGANFDYFMACLKEKLNKARPSQLDFVEQNRLLDAVPHLIAAARDIVRRLEGMRNEEPTDSRAFFAAGDILLDALAKAELFPCDGIYRVYDANTKRYQRIPVSVLSATKKKYRIRVLVEINIPPVRVQENKVILVNRDDVTLNKNEIQM